MRYVAILIMCSCASSDPFVAASDAGIGQDAEPDTVADTASDVADEETGPYGKLGDDCAAAAECEILDTQLAHLGSVGSVGASCIGLDDGGAGFCSFECGDGVRCTALHGVCTYYHHGLPYCWPTQ